MELLKEYGQEPTASCASKEEAEVLAENYNLSKNVGQS
jgi:hypothetical protein